jgi:hypothetical protein
MEGGTSDNFDFSSTWIMRSDKSEHTSSLIFWSCSEDSTGSMDCSLSGDDGTLGWFIETVKFKA